jgi:hypothetical protein
VRRTRPVTTFNTDGPVETDWPASDDYRLKQPPPAPEPEDEEPCGVKVVDDDYELIRDHTGREFIVRRPWW